jgi:hypothetical protein
VSYPTSPPLMPPPGWYPDPESAWTWRWWDGARWTDLRAPQTLPPERNPYSFSAWFEQAVEASKRVIVRVGLVVLAIWGVVAALVGVFALSVFNSGKGRELRDLIQFDRIVDGSTTTVELTDAEWERAGELLGDIARAAAPWMVVLFVVLIVASTWATALAARVAERVRSDTVDAVSRSDDAADAMRRVPAVVGALFAFSLIGLGVMTSTLLPLFVAIAADAGGGAIAVTGIFGFVAALVVGSLVFVRLSLAVVLASLGGWGLGLRRSWQLTEGHFWGVLGRLLVAALIAGAASFPLSVLNSFGLRLGVTTWVVSFLVFQAIGNVVTTVVNAPAQVVIVRQLTARQGLGRLA